MVENALRPNYIHLIKPVSVCIAATKVGEKPQNDLAALLKDIDTAFGSAYDYLKTSNSFREELIVSENKYFTDETWQQMCLEFLKGVRFYSDYGKTNFKPLVEKNLKNYGLLINSY
ncbi:MAG: hypothetical protein HC803_00465 [Saprospiraceae bacterium]|nr:hypothetical protein [Saprospiraceae bacterium]